MVIMNDNENRTVVMKVRFPEYLHDWIKQKAKTEMRSMAQQISYFIDKEYTKDTRFPDSSKEGDVKRQANDSTGEEGRDADTL